MCKAQILLFLLIAALALVYCAPASKLTNTETDDNSLVKEHISQIVHRIKRQDFGSFNQVGSGPARPNYVYTPLIKYRETYKKKKRLFVPNFFG